MKRRYLNTIRVLPVLLIVGCVAGLAGQLSATAGQNNSLYLRAEEELSARKVRGGTVNNAGSVTVGKFGSPIAGQKLNANLNRRSVASGGAFGLEGRNRSNIAHNTSSVNEASWFAVKEPTPKDFREHDLVTIIVHEVSKHSVKADAKSEREQTIEFKLKDWLRLSGGNLRPDRQSRGDPSIAGDFDREFEGKSNIKREDTLSARIQAEIIDVLPNGTLVLEATHTMVVDEETTLITLTGTCRSKDINIDNTIISSKIARLEIKKTHTGMARDTTKRSLLARALDYLNPF
ncbi:MAG: flagellar basal body L-ring protein FlgH [Sedimentisphaerales bacterium]|nr:flagellar basal body L-ring protein FlgH [Sedimentisphaerales bacterium]